MKVEDIITERTIGTNEVDTAACVELLREIVTATDGVTRLARHRVHFKHEGYERGESWTTPQEYKISSELVERALVALGLPVPIQAPPVKKQSVPTTSQAALLDALHRHGAKLVRSTNYGTRYWLEPLSFDMRVSATTFEVLQRLDWIEQIENDQSWRRTEFVVSTKGTEALDRFNSKKAKEVTA